VSLAAAVEVPATVQRISDGDTIVVTLADGSEVKVRLL
jgi:endonuclease YncB( thermonuclease family)